MGDNEQGSEIQALGSQEAPPVVLSKTDDTEINIGALNTASSKCSAESARIWEILDYMRSTFDSDAMLDDLPISEAANDRAWKAWKAHRQSTSGRLVAETNPDARQASPSGTSDWNWDGVWQDRVHEGIRSSMSKPTLFGGDGEDFVCCSSPSE